MTIWQRTTQSTGTFPEAHSPTTPRWTNVSSIHADDYARPASSRTASSNHPPPFSITSYSSPAASQPCQVPPSRASPSTSALAKPKKSSWPADRIDVSQIPTVLDWSTLFHFLLPSAPEIKFGEKEEGSPRWSNWLESWYVAYDPLVWALMLRDDADDAADEAALRRDGLKLLAEGASEEEIKYLEAQHDLCLVERLLRRERLLFLHLVRDRFLRYHQDHDPSLTLAETLSRAERGNKHLLCPYPPASIWPSFKPHPHGDRSYTSYRFLRNDPANNERLCVPATPSHESERARSHYFDNFDILCAGAPVPPQAPVLPSPPSYEAATSPSHSAGGEGEAEAEVVAPDTALYPLFCPPFL